MPLFDNAELVSAHEKYVAEQAQNQAERPKSKAQILIEIVSADPSYTVSELAEGSGRSKTWVRRTLKTARLKAAPGRRP